MIKEMDCVNYFPGDITAMTGKCLSSLMKRTSYGDNQRKTEIYYIYAMDNLLGGK